MIREEVGACATAAVCLALAIPLIASAQVSADPNASIEATVRAQFAMDPVMIDIARCESEFTQFGKGGGALHGGAGNRMVGVFQIHETVHAAYARSIGMDIDTIEGNLAYARYLFEREGTTPWVSSSPCWNAEHNSLSINLSFGMDHPQVGTLQKLLNENGFTIASEGPGSPGNETTYYGALTRDAVRALQCARGIVCDGDESSSGFGLVGPQTRMALGTATDQSLARANEPIEPNADQEDEIARLQAQIAELTQLLAELMQPPQS